MNSFKEFLEEMCLKLKLLNSVARFFDTIYQKGGKYTKLPQHYQTAVKYSK
jgi:hypothetical protein